MSGFSTQEGFGLNALRCPSMRMKQSKGKVLIVSAIKLTAE
jgi:hypothetical protein